MQLRLDHLGQSTRKHFFQHLGITVIGKANHGERANRTSTHGIYITQRIGGSNLSEDVWVVDDGGEEIYSLDERQLRRELIHTSVVGCVEADQDIGIVLPG